LRVRVYEANPSFGMGSTGKAAGGVRAQFGTEVNCALSMYSIREFESLAAVHGADVSFRQYGYLFVSSSERTDQYLDDVTAMQSRLGVPVRRLAKTEIEEMAPYLNTSDLLSGSFSPTDGYLDPFAVCAFYHGEARRLGAEAASTVRVSDRGDVNAETIVLCAGHWSAEAGAALGIDVPVTREKHQLALTQPVEGLPERLPMVVDLDTSFHFRREGEGVLIGFNDPQGDPHDPSDAFEFGFLERMADVGLRRLPMLERFGFDTKQCWAGFYAETPDRHAIIGWIDGVLVCTGFGGHGVMHSPAAGQAVAEVIVDGAASSFDVAPLRPSRFAEGNLTLEPMVI
jgi:sarcosine oxidase subunit beta